MHSVGGAWGSAKRPIFLCQRYVAGCRCYTAPHKGAAVFSCEQLARDGIKVLLFQLRHRHYSLYSAQLRTSASPTSLHFFCFKRYHVKHHSYALEIVRIFSKLHNVIDDMLNMFLRLYRAENARPNLSAILWTSYCLHVVIYSMLL